MSGLNINFNKLALITFGCEEAWVEEIRRMMHCLVVKLPIAYLGIPLGASPHRVETWKLMIEKIKKRLPLWKEKLLSRAGRLVLIEFVLNSLPLYYLSIFKIPKKVATQIIKLQRHFL